jgi:predicted nucleic acid-binding protein
MPADFFLDTDVFVYTCDASAPAKRARGRELVRAALETGTGVIRWQVAQEFLNVALHRFERPLTPREAADYLDQVLAPLCCDSLVVAGASAAGARTLCTEDLQSGRELRGLRTENPFA